MKIGIEKMKLAHKKRVAIKVCAQLAWQYECFHYNSDGCICMTLCCVSAVLAVHAHTLARGPDH